uniref:Cytochrome P450 n=1 Tax=Caenorhabditis tropicalis TaxID=1561998 RepID=A0A1I7TRP1_9PELO
MIRLATMTLGLLFCIKEGHEKSIAVGLIFGKIFGYMEGSVPVLVISDLDVIQEIFVRKFDHFYARKLTNMLHGDMENSTEEPIVNLFVARGSRWKRLRALASPVFTVNSLKKIHPTMEDSILVMMNHLEQNVNGQGINIHEYFQELTYDVISRLAMGQPDSQLFNNPGIQVTKAVFMRTHRVLPWYLAVAFPKYQFQIKKLFINHENVRGGDIGQIFMFCAKSVMSRLQERVSCFARTNGMGVFQAENAKLGVENTERDFIDMFLNFYSETAVEDTEFGTAIEKKVNAEDVIGACFVFLLAGFDTTANALAYAAFLLARHPEKMRLAQEEIEKCCLSESISYDDTTKLKYLDSVVKEALRLYPIGWFACSRECVASTDVGGIRIEKGTMIEVDVMAVHRSKEIWGDDADDFNPERWLNPKPRHTMSWIPFGAGNRQCVGLKLGMSEAKTTLAHLLRKYNIRTGPDTEEKLQLLGCTTTSPKSVTIYLEPRF